MKIKLLGIMFFLSQVILGFEQINAQINGMVISAGTQQPLVDVEVMETSSGIFAITREDGSFSMDLENKVGTNLIFFKDGYDVYELEIDSIAESYSIEMDQWSIELSDIEFVRKRQEIFATKKLDDIDGTSIYAGKKTEVVVMDLVTGNTAANVSRQVYAQISGLNIYEGSDGGLQLNIGGRGLDPNRTSNFNTRQNGYDISADVLGYPENYYTPPTDALEEIRILRGASSLQYGSQFGGLIDFRIRKIPNYRKWDIRSKQTYGSFNFFNSFNSIGYNTKKFSVDAFYNYKRGDGYRENSAFKVNNGFLSIQYRISENSKISFDFTYYNYLAKQAGGLTDAQFAENPRLSTRERNWFQVDWRLYNLKFLHNFNTSAKMELNLFGLNAERKSVGYRGNPAALNENPILGLDEQNNAGEYLNPRDLILGRFRNVGAEIKYLRNYQMGTVSSVLLLGTKLYKSNNSSIQGPGSAESDADFRLMTTAFPDYANQSNFDFPNLNIALFAENILYLSDKFSITPGLRYEYIKTESDGVYTEVLYDLAGNPISNEFFEEARDLPRSFLLAGVGMDYKFSDKLKYSINLSQNYRSVTFSDLRVANPSFIIDENISDEKGMSLSTGITGRMKSRFSYDVGLYSVLYNNRIGIKLDNRANRVRTNIGNALIVGTESLINFIIHRHIENNKKIFQAKTFLNSSYTYSRYLSSDNNNVTGNTVEFIPTINIKSGLALDYKKLNASIQYSYTSTQYTDAQNSQASLTNDLRAGIIGQIPSYQIIDFSLACDFRRFVVQGGFNNLLDRSYYTRRATGYPGPGIIPSDGRSFYCTVSYVFQR